MKLFVLLISLLLCLTIQLKDVEAAEHEYPLQYKYPNIMLYKGNTNDKIVALTFDDGPDDRFTPEVLNVLKKNQIRATFFLLSSRVEKYPSVAKRIKDEGHVIGNHTYWHPDLTQHGINRFKWELEQAENKINDTIGLTTNLFRAPYGAMDDKMVQELGNLGYKGIGWSVDSEDWKSLPKDKIMKNVLNEIHPGAIILMHSAGHWTQDLSGTVEALDEIIPYLKKRGYHFVTVPELWDKTMK